MDTYLTVTSSAEYQLTEKRSRFLGFAMHVDDNKDEESIV
jgi:putative IMPACT (imprinted ancient) family translation regulator